MSDGTDRPRFTYAPPANSADDIVAYEKEVNRFLSGEIDSAEFKHIHVVRGIYEQRRDGTFMVRIRVAAGRFTPQQGDVIAQLAKEFGNGQVHVTTRQDLQLHDVQVADTPEIMRRLLDVGIACLGGGGNTVRNVSASPFAGVCPAEYFDVGPFAEAVTEYLISLPGSFTLPRKYKVAFAGSSDDAGYAHFTDLGFVAALRDGLPGFKVYAGGGLGAKCRAADLVAEWIPAADCVRMAEAIRRFFDRHGDRTNRNRARLRYVFERLELEQCRNEIDQLYKAVSDEDVPLVDATFQVLKPSGAAVPMAQLSPRRIHGLRCIPQRDQGLYGVVIPLPMGFIDADQFRGILKLADQFGVSSQVRTMQDQNLLLTNIPENKLEALAGALMVISSELVEAGALANFVSCTGASTCRLGICLSRGAAKASADALDQSSIAPEIVDLLDLRISGCPNSCGQHPLADIGFSGGARKHDGHSYPNYRVAVGARSTGESAALAEPVGKIPAKRMPDALVAMVGSFERMRLHDERFSAYVQRMGLDHFTELLAPFQDAPGYDEDPSFYRDHGREIDFSPKG